MGESRPKVGDALPDGVVHERGAARDATMQLRGDEPVLPLEISGVVRPGFDQGVDVLGRDGEDVDENDGFASLVGQLITDRDGPIHLLHLDHAASWR